jgi:hypothetical protein
MMQQPGIVAPGMQPAFGASGRDKATAPAPDPIGFSPVRCRGVRPSLPVPCYAKGGDGGSTSTAPTERDDDEDSDDLDDGKSTATKPVMKVGNCHVTCLTPPELVSATTADSFDFSVVGWGGASNGVGQSSAHHGIGGQRVSGPWSPPPRHGPGKSHALVSELAFTWITPTQRAASAARQQQNQKQHQPRPKRQGPKPRSDPHFLRKTIDEALNSPTPMRGRSAEVTVSSLKMASPVKSLGDAPWKHATFSEAPADLRSLPIDAPLPIPFSARQGRLRSRTTSPPPASPAPTSSLLKSANRGLSRSASNLIMDGSTSSLKHIRVTTSAKGPSSVGAKAKDARPHKSATSVRGRERPLAEKPKVDAACHHHHHHGRSRSLGRFQATRRQEPEGFAARDAEAYPSTPTPQPGQQRSLSFTLAGSSPDLGSTFFPCEHHAWSVGTSPFSPSFDGADQEHPLDVVALPPPPPSLRRTGSEAAREVGLTDEQLQRLREAGFRITPRDSS